MKLSGEAGWNVSDTALPISQGLRCEPKQAAVGTHSHTALPQAGPEATHLGDTHRHSVSNKKQVGYQ